MGLTQTNEDGIYDARSLGRAKMIVLGLQHMFAMFGATVLVPAITGLSVSSTLLFAGLETLLFHFLTKRMVPAFLGSSFAFLGGYAAVCSMGADQGLTQAQALPYACVGVFFFFFFYFFLSVFIKFFGLKRVFRYFPPIVIGSIIIAICFILSGSAITNCQANWWIALLAIAVVIICNIWGKGMIKIIPILMGVFISYIVAACFGMVDFSTVQNASWIGVPFKSEDTVLAVFQNTNSELLISAIIAVMPIALATMIEHIGDICAISSTCNRNYLANPGLHRTLLGDGLATSIAALFGAPANTTYGENTGVLNLTKVFDPKVIRIAAVFAILFSFSPTFAAVVSAMPVATIGGVSLVLYGMISAVGVRNIVENKVDFSKSRNVIIAALILVLSIGINYSAAGAIAFSIGSVNISLSGLAVG